MENIFGVVIIYYPDEQLAANIRSYLPYLKRLLIIDNTPSQFRAGIEWPDEYKVMHYHDGENKGIAKRLNDAARQAKNEGCNWLLTMDQDSRFDNFEHYYNCFIQFAEKNKISAFGVEYEKEFESKDCNYSDVMQLITSGSIINIDIWERLKGFDENLFIDEVDFEYCYRSIATGFRVVKFNNVFLRHTIGRSQQFISVKSLKKSNRALHSPMRIYYMVRNHLYVKNKYHHLFKDVFKLRRKDIAVTLKNNILYNTKRLEVLKAVYWAIIHYKQKKMGKPEDY